MQLTQQEASTIRTANTRNHSNSAPFQDISACIVHWYLDSDEVFRRGQAIDFNDPCIVRLTLRWLRRSSCAVRRYYDPAGHRTECGEVPPCSALGARFLARASCTSAGALVCAAEGRLTALVTGEVERLAGGPTSGHD